MRVYRTFSFQLEHRDKLLHARNRQFFMLKCISENESRFEVLRVAIGTGAKQGRISENRLQSEMIAQDQVIENLWNDFGIPGASRVYRKSNLRPDTECAVHRSRDILIERDAHTRIDTIDT